MQRQKANKKDTEQGRTLVQTLGTVKLFFLDYSKEENTEAAKTRANDIFHTRGSAELKRNVGSSGDARTIHKGGKDSAEPLPRPPTAVLCTFGRYACGSM